MQALRSIQALRALAAFCVVVYHSAVLYALPKYGGQTTFAGLTEYGQYGVDLFFVISGFIIANAHWKDIGSPHRLGRYVTRRFTRVYPVYWIFLTGMVLLVFMGIGTDEAPSSLTNLLQSYSLVRLTPEKPPLLVAWTLFHEIFFYSIFALLILSKRVGAALFAAWTVLILASFTLTGPAEPHFWTVITDLIDLEFMFGIAVFLWLKNKDLNPTVITGTLCVGIVVLVIAAMFHDIGSFEPMPQARVLYGLGFAAMLSAIVSMEKLSLFVVPQTLVFVGYKRRCKIRPR